MRFRQRLSQGRQRGEALIEFSLVAVQLFLVLIAAVEFARIIVIYTNIANAARVGARYAITHGGTRTGSGPDGPSGPAANPPEVVAVVEDFARSGLVDMSVLTPGISVEYLPPPGLTGAGCNSPGCQVRVTVRYTYDPLILPGMNVPLGSMSQGIITY